MTESVRMWVEIVSIVAIAWLAYANLFPRPVAGRVLATSEG